MIWYSDFISSTLILCPTLPVHLTRIYFYSPHPISCANEISLILLTQKLLMEHFINMWMRGFFDQLFCQCFCLTFLLDFFAQKVWGFFWQMAFGKQHTYMANFNLLIWLKICWWNWATNFSPSTVCQQHFACRTKFGEIDLCNLLNAPFSIFTPLC